MDCSQPSTPLSSDLLSKFSLLSPETARILLPEIRKRREFIESGRKFYAYYPDDDLEWRGQTFHARAKYPKHIEFFEAGTTHRERCAIASNRVGKTEGMGGYEMTCHLTGLYPDWWPGKRFDRAVNAWGVGEKGDTVRDIVQFKLLGPPHAQGTGLIPRDCILNTTSKPGVPDGVEHIYVRHATGGTSTITLKSYKEGRKAFEGTEQDVIWLDEEPPMDVYGECLIRTMTTQGLIMVTFTPLDGISDVVLSFMPEGRL